MSSNKKRAHSNNQPLSNTYLKSNNFKKLNFFNWNIYKVFLAFIKNNLKEIKSLIKGTIVSLIFFFVIFYSPLFWYLGNHYYIMIK